MAVVAEVISRRRRCCRLRLDGLGDAESLTEVLKGFLYSVGNGRGWDTLHGLKAADDGFGYVHSQLQVVAGEGLLQYDHRLW